ncbi:MAG: class II glutamine amidotransferase [Pseudomonadota bacterium]
MCELFGVSSAKPVKLRYSLEEFAKHGGLLHPNKSGWGIAYYEGRDVLLLKEASPAATSPWVDFIHNIGLDSHVVIAHVRYATAGEPAFENTHPFRRELGGQAHVFAHNGTLEGIFERMPLVSEFVRPIGLTDSEHAFCVLMERLEPLWRRSAGKVPDLSARLELIAETAAELRQLGSANFLYSDGDCLFAHAHRRSFDEGDHFSPPRPPGLCLGNRLDIAKDFEARGLKLALHEPETPALMLASVPLSKHGWTPLPEGSITALRNGVEVARV